VRQRATEGAQVPDLRVGHRRGGLGQQRHVLVDQIVVEHVVVWRHRADRDAVTLVAHPAQLGDPTEVDQH
jgi:hypothetical protein